MKRDLLAGLFFSLTMLALVVLAIGVDGCRTALQVSTRIYECHQEVKEGGSITLRDCKVTDDDQAEGAPASDQAGDDAVDVDANDEKPEASIRAIVTPAVIAIVKRTSQGSASDLAIAREAAALAERERRRASRPRKRKRKTPKGGRVRVAGYTRRRPVRRRRRK